MARTALILQQVSSSKVLISMFKICDNILTAFWDLITFCAFNPDDITVLIDDGNPKHVQYTKENLVGMCTVLFCLNSQIFVEDTKHGRSRSWREFRRSVLSSLSMSRRASSLFYVLVSGGRQLADDNEDEEDGWDECMSFFIFFSDNWLSIMSYRYTYLRPWDNFRWCRSHPCICICHLHWLRRARL